MFSDDFLLKLLVAFVAFVDFQSSLLTLDHQRTSSHGARLIAALHINIGRTITSIMLMNFAEMFAKLTGIDLSVD